MLPTIRLRPKTKPQAIRHGFPWVYADELVLDRRTRALLPGSFALLEDDTRRPMGVVTVNPGSKITARMMDPDPEASIDRGWIAARLSRALAMRQRLYDQPFYRLVHAEADGLPGLVIDRFGTAAVIQPNAAWADTMAADIAAALAEVAGVTTIILNGTGRARGPEGLPERTEVLLGEAPAPIPVPMNGATYMADLMGGQKTGLFFDQRPNHAFAQRLAAGARVLDVFSHVGGFGLAALAAGAAQATCVDGSAPALALAERGAQAMGAADRLTLRQGDAFATLEALATSMTRAVADWQATLRALAPADLTRTYRPDGWTVAQLAHHTADAHLHGLSRLRHGLTQEEFHIQPFDQAAWLTLPDSALPVGVAAQLLEALNAHWVSLLRGVPADRFSRQVVHPAEGRQDLWQLAAKHDWHLRHHLAHVHLARTHQAPEPQVTGGQS